jgi:hypothetical protein
MTAKAPSKSKKPSINVAESCERTVKAFESELPSKMLKAGAQALHTLADYFGSTGLAVDDMAIYPNEFSEIRRERRYFSNTSDVTASSRVVAFTPSCAHKKALHVQFKALELLSHFMLPAADVVPVDEETYVYIKVGKTTAVRLNRLDKAYFRGKAKKQEVIPLSHVSTLVPAYLCESAPISADSIRPISAGSISAGGVQSMIDEHVKDYVAGLEKATSGDVVQDLIDKNVQSLVDGQADRTITADDVVDAFPETSVQVGESVHGSAALLPVLKHGSKMLRQKARKIKKVAVQIKIDAGKGKKRAKNKGKKK